MSMYKQECIKCDFEVYHHNIIPLNKTVKHDSCCTQ